MFKFKYKMTSGSETTIVSLSPTKGTLAKAFLPSVVIFVGASAYGWYLDRQSKKYESTHIHPSMRIH